MSAQSEQMKVMVSELIAIVGGSGTGAARSLVAAANTPKTVTRRALELATPVKRARCHALEAETSKEVTPQQAIPFDDQDFKDF